jgi:uncharacterized lipoprotein NlpE involved in copper resistance
MKKIIYLFMAILAVTVLGSCLSTKKVDIDTSKIVDIHNSRISVSWDGAYAGTIPSADGSGINVLIVLNNDNTFVLKYSYVELPENTYTYSGSFKWNNGGNIIVLKIKDMPPYYWVGQDKLTQLDMQGKVITGTYAQDYVLEKIFP